jgi:hypothetical protein
MKVFGVSLIALVIILFLGYMLGRNMPSLIPKIAGY